MIDGLFLQSVEGLEDGLLVRMSEKAWPPLQGQKQALTVDLLASAPRCQNTVSGLQETDGSEEKVREIE